MTEHPFFLDLLIAPFVMLIIEPVIVQKNYRVFSPFTIFICSFIFLYIMPYAIHFYWNQDVRLSRLSQKDFSIAFSILRFFFYTWCLISFFFLKRIKYIHYSPVQFNIRQLRQTFRYILASYLIISIIRLGIGVGFSPAVMLDRLFYPLLYTHIALGLGPLTECHRGLKFLLIMIASVLFYSFKQRFLAISILFIIFFLIVIGGNKSVIVLPFLCFVIVSQRINNRIQSQFKKFWKMVFVSIVSCFLVVAGFALLTPGEAGGLRNAVSRIPSYHKEAYYLPLVVQKFSWSVQNVTTHFLDTVLSPIPRALWNNKPYMGLWNRLFRPMFEPNTVLYHTSTFGCLSEAHILGGHFGPFLYAVMWAILMYQLNIYLFKGTLLKLFLTSLSGYWTYFIMRTGFFGSNIATISVIVIIGWFFLRRYSTVIKKAPYKYSMSLSVRRLRVLKQNL